jgi:hypothetical protein
VTLNITLVTADRIYQSSDFRLTILKPFEIIETPSSKIVQLHYDNLDGILSYTGVGRWPRKDSPDLAVEVAKWLEGADFSTVVEIAEVIRVRGDDFLAKVARRAGRQQHTFTIAAFENRIPSVALISNFEYVNGDDPPQTLPALAVTTKAFRRSSFVV